MGTFAAVHTTVTSAHKLNRLKQNDLQLTFKSVTDAILELILRLPCLSIVVFILYG